MSSYIDKVHESQKKNNYKLTADKIIQSLNKVREERSTSRRRWIWELMQNAKDVENIFKGVTIEIILRERELVFSHNGDPFRIEQLTGLVQQVSSLKPSDSSDKRITGKFGTGFISTHLLSEKVLVRGIVELDDLLPKSFEIELNRKAESSEELILTIEKELRIIEQIEDVNLFPILPNYSTRRLESHFDTVFTYPLESRDSYEAARTGIDDLALTLPQTLIFVKELKKVIIKDETEGTSTVYELLSATECEGYNIPTIRRIIDGEESNLFFIHYIDEDISLAIPINNLSEKAILTTATMPKLYRDFPLIGSEDFHFPYLLNGFSFFPTDSRDGIFMTEGTNQNIVNRRILKHAMEKARSLTEWLIRNKARNLCFVVRSRIPKGFKEEEKETVAWYTENIQKPYRNFIMESEVVETAIENIKLRGAIIPKFDGTDEQNEFLWEILCTYFGPSKICKKEQLKLWQYFIGPKEQIETWGGKVFYELKDLLVEIQSKTTLENIVPSKKEVTNVEWLNSLYRFIIECGQTAFFKEYKIIPSIKGTLKSLKDDLFLEKGGNIPDELIVIYKKLKNDDWNEILINRGLITIDSTHASKSIKDISEEINKVLNHEEKNHHGQVQKRFMDIPGAEDSLLSILRITSSKSGDTFQSKLFASAKRFFNASHEPLHVPDIGEFNFSPAKRQMIKLLHKRIESAGNLDDLKIEDSNRWLRDHLILIQESSEFKELLEFGNIIPNRRCVFRAYKDEIYSYGTTEEPLDDVLIDALFDLNNKEDWKSILLHEDFKSLKLPEKKMETLAAKLKESIEDLKNRGAYPSKSDTLLKLIKWCSDSQNYSTKSKHFDWLDNQKNNIFVNISIEDSEIGGNVARLLSKKEKLSGLVSLAESGADLQKLLEIAEISKTVDLEDIRSTAQVKKEEKEDFEFKKQLGESIEKAFIDAFRSVNLPYELIYQGLGSQDVIIKNNANQRTFLLELKSISPASQDKSVKLSLSQAIKSVEQINEGNYVVSVLVRPDDWQSATTDYVKDNLHNVFEMGLFVNSVVEKNSLLEEMINDPADVSIAFDDTRRKVKVSELVWRSNGRSFNDLIEKVKGYLQ
jgi:hypothetical protein